LVDLEWDLDGTFASLVGSLADSSQTTITGLTAATAYYFRLLPKTVWRNNEQGYFGNHAEHPTISSFTTSLIKPTSVVVGWGNGLLGG
jgi:hypothetical protein